MNKPDLYRQFSIFDNIDDCFSRNVISYTSNDDNGISVLANYEIVKNDGDKKPGFVYVARYNSHHFKIGCTTRCVRERLSAAKFGVKSLVFALQTINPFTLLNQFVI